MNSNSKLACAIAAILTTPATFAANADTPNASATTALDEVVVTAQRRTESIQDVPITIQALTADTLTKLNIVTFDDMIRYLPNVTSSNLGPGQNNIFMRGLSAGTGSIEGSGSQASFPNVAIYLDDQSGQLPGRNLDVYAVDLERVEVLEGPQGTLFGAGAQAGVIRYITNKPKLDGTEAIVNAGYGVTAHGDPNTNADATLNLPLISDTFALRGVIYTDSRGGYIDNVPSTFTRKLTDLGVVAGFDGGAVALGNFPIVNNNAIAADNINPVTYKGARLSGLYKFNDDWNILVSQAYQSMDAAGVFYQMPKGSDGQSLPKLSVTLFSPSNDRDKFENTAWTVNGKFGDLKAVYTGGYLVRNVDQVQDYSNYSRGVYADYYQCHGSDGGAIVPTCYSPINSWHEKTKATHLSNELRLSTPDDWRLRGIVGAFWEQFKIYDQVDWRYRSLPECTTTLTTGCMTSMAPAPGGTVGNPGIRDSNTSFFYDAQRGFNQRAFFVSADFDLIPKVLTVTLGTRYYHFSEAEKGSVNSGFGCYEAGIAPCGGAAGHGTNLDAQGLNLTYSGFKSRANVSWHPREDVLLYYTWSQGFRPGGFNTTTACHIPTTAAPNGQFCVPASYGSDVLTNNEFGWKTEFANRRIQFNGAIYREDWKNAQTAFFDPGVTGNLSFQGTGPSYRVQGVEVSFMARVVPGLTLTTGAAYNKSKLVESPGLLFNNPAYAGQPGYGEPIPGLDNLYGPLGSPAANSPKFQGNIRLRYEWSFQDYDAFFQVGAAYMGKVFTQPANQPAGNTNGVSTSLERFEIPSYTTVNASIGVAKDKWNASISAENLGNSDSYVYAGTGSFIFAETPLRPRVITFKLGYKF